MATSPPPSTHAAQREDTGSAGRTAPVLVVGATGQLGTQICTRLRAADLPVRALVRATSDRATVDRLQALGAEIVTGDLRDRASLDVACSTVGAVVSTATAIGGHQPGDSIIDIDKAGHAALVEAARAAGVGHFVYTSFSSGLEVDSPMRAAKRSTERRLWESGLSYTILRPTAFMEVWLSPLLGFDYVNAHARIYGTGENPISYISLEDVADFAREGVLNPAARNQVLELGGPEPLAPLKVVRIFETVGQRKFQLAFVPEDVLRAQYAEATEMREKTFAALLLSIARGDAIEVEETLERFPVRLATVRRYAERVAGRVREATN